MKNYLRGGGNMLKQQQECTINVHVYDQWSGMSIQSLFRTQWLAPKKLVHQLRMEKRVSVNDSLAIWTAPLEAGDDIFITFPNELNNTIIPFKTTIQIVYEDEHLLIVNKPAGMATHVNEQNEMDTLANAVAFYLQGQNDNRKIRHIHRLDKETTGAIIFAKHALSHAILDQMLENNEIDRTYLALTDGLMKKVHSRFVHQSEETVITQQEDVFPKLANKQLHIVKYLKQSPKNNYHSLNAN